MLDQSQRIDSKKEYYALARRHLLGNTIRQWTVDQFLDGIDDNPGEFPKVVALRGMTPASKSIQAYDVPVYEAKRRLYREILVTPKWEILIDEQAPDHLSTLKGEVMRDERYMYLRYDMTPGLRMRAAYTWDGSPDQVIPARCRGMAHAWGLEVQGLLKRYMDTGSWEMLMDLFDRFPDSIVEFSCYSKRIGNFGMNTVFWEVRNY